MAAAASSRDPAVGLAAVAALRRLLESLEELQVANARAQGWSWQQIADALAVSRQAVHKKYRRVGPVAARTSRRRVDVLERFTEKARTAVVLAQQEARERGDDDGRPGPPAARAVRGAGQPGRDGAGGVLGAARRRRGRPGPAPPGRTGDRATADAERARRAGHRPRRGAASGRGGVRSGRAGAGPRPRAPAVGAATSRSRRSPRRCWSWRCARRSRLGHNYIGTEHMLLGMLRGEGAARDVLVARGVRLDVARVIVEELVRGRRAG